MLNDGEGRATGPDAESAQDAVAKQHTSHKAIRILYIMGSYAKSESIIHNESGSSLVLLGTDLSQCTPPLVLGTS